MTESGAGDSMQEILAAKLRVYDGPAYRRAYLANLLESGMRFSAAGNARSADYCFAKVAGELAHVEINDSDKSQVENHSDDPGESSRANPDTGDDADSDSKSKSDSDSKTAARTDSVSPPKKTIPQKRSPMDLLRARWRQERIKNAESILKAQSGRLSALEKQSFQEKLDKLSASDEPFHTRSQSAKLDKDLLDIRHRLYRRVLKAQKAVMRARRLDGPRRLDGIRDDEARRLAESIPFAVPPVAGAPPTPGTEPGSADGASILARADGVTSGLPEPSQLSVESGTETKDAPAPPILPAPRPTAFAGSTAKGPLVGPYNDRYNLGDLLALMGRTDPAWVDEFLDLYRGLDEVKGVLSALAAQARK